MGVDADTLARAQAGDGDARRAVARALAAPVVARVGDEGIAIAALGAVLADLPRYGLGVDKLESWAVTRAGKRAATAPPVATRKSGRIATGTTAPATEAAPPDVLERVVDGALVAGVPTGFAAHLAHRRRTSPAVVAAVIAAACVATLVIAFIRTTPSTRGGPESGTVEAAAATTSTPIARGVAVLAPGAAIEWRGGQIQQRAGSVFYRIEPGGMVVVRTPHGEITTTRACLRVTIGDGTTAITIDEGDALIGGTRMTAGDARRLP